MSKYKLKKNTGQNCIFSLLQLISACIANQKKHQLNTNVSKMHYFLLIIIYTVIMFKL